MSDDNIIFMNSMDLSSDPRHSEFGSIFDSFYDANSFETTLGNNKKSNSTYEFTNLYKGAQFDYVGDDVNVHSFIHLLTQRYSKFTPWYQRLRSEKTSNILLFMSGHGGEEFFKFQDQDDLTANQLGQILNEMDTKHLYNRILLLVDTCKSETFLSQVKAKNIIIISSSASTENSYAHSINTALGVSLIDRFALSILRFFERTGDAYLHDSDKDKNIHSRPSQRSLSLQSLIDSFDIRFLQSTVVVRQTLDRTSQSVRSLSDIPLSDFFGP